MIEPLPRVSPDPLIDKDKMANNSTQTLQLPKGYFPPPPDTGISSDMDTLAPPLELRDLQIDNKESRPTIRSQTELTLNETALVLREELQALHAASMEMAGTLRLTKRRIPSFTNIIRPWPTDSSNCGIGTEQAVPGIANTGTTPMLACEINTRPAEASRSQNQRRSPPIDRAAMPVDAMLALEVAALRAEVDEMRAQQQLDPGRGTPPDYSPPTRPIPGIPFVEPVGVA
jgi:hypothetical protein